MWLLILTCVCGEPKQSHFATREACIIRADWEMFDRNITVVRYRCEKVKS